LVQRLHRGRMISAQEVRAWGEAAEVSDVVVGTGHGCDTMVGVAVGFAVNEDAGDVDVTAPSAPARFLVCARAAAGAASEKLESRVRVPSTDSSPASMLIRYDNKGNDKLDIQLAVTFS
jgi:hypothetical protein